MKQPEAAEKTYIQAKVLAKPANHTEHLDMLTASHAIMPIDNKRDAEARTFASESKFPATTYYG